MTASDHVERELKLGAWPEFTLPDLADIDGGVRAGEPARRDLDAHYYDTADLHLLRRGVTLRFRRGEPPGDVWTLKLPSETAEHGLARREITVRGRRDAVPRQFADLTRGWALGHPLRPVARLHTLRLTVPLVDERGVTLATLDDDAVTARRGRRTLARFRELEVELADDAAPELLRALDERLRAAGAEKVPQIPKLDRALGRDAVRAWQLEASPVTTKTSMGAAAQAYLTRQLAELADAHALLVLGAEGGIAPALGAAESLRTGLDALAPLLGMAPPPSASETLARLARELTRLAELEALAEGTRHEQPTLTRAETSELGERVEQGRERAHHSVVRILREARYAALLGGLERLVTAAPATSGQGGRRVTSAGPKFVRGCRRGIRTDPGADEEALARLRCALELVAPLKSEATSALEAVRALQAALAGRNEARARVARLRSLARRADGRAAWAAGVLAGVETAWIDEAGARVAELQRQLTRKANWTWAD